jgi:hypothetical protein
MSASQFDKILQVRAPGALTELLDAAAAKQLVGRSSYIRSALVDRLRADGMGGDTWGQSESAAHLTTGRLSK